MLGKMLTLCVRECLVQWTGHSTDVCCNILDLYLSATSNTSCHNGDIRLAGGRDSTEGRVEICYNGRWGTVCDDLFGNSDARVICRQLGFTSGRQAHAHVCTSVK